MRNLKKSVLGVAAMVAFSGLVLGAPASAADRLTVKDSGNAVKFVVQDTGATGIGTALPGVKLEIQDTIAGTATGTTGVQSVYNNNGTTNKLRYRLRGDGASEWYLVNNTTEVGEIAYAYPSNKPGIVFFTYDSVGGTYGQRFDLLNKGTVFAIAYNGKAGLYVADTSNVGIGTQAPTAKLDVAGDRIRVQTALTPAQGATCNVGDHAWGVDYIYVCTAANTWKRAALTSY